LAHIKIIKIKENGLSAIQMFFSRCINSIFLHMQTSCSGCLDMLILNWVSKTGGLENCETEGEIELPHVFSITVTSPASSSLSPSPSPSASYFCSSTGGNYRRANLGTR